jgi:hypothetical protein
MSSPLTKLWKSIRNLCVNYDEESLDSIYVDIERKDGTTNVVLAVDVCTNTPDGSSNTEIEVRFTMSGEKLVPFSQDKKDPIVVSIQSSYIARELYDFVKDLIDKSNDTYGFGWKTLELSTFDNTAMVGYFDEDGSVHKKFLYS